MMTILDTIKRKREFKHNESHDHEDYFYTESEGIIARWAASEEGQRFTQRIIEIVNAASMTIVEYGEFFASIISAELPPDEKQAARDRSRADLQSKRKQMRGQNRHIR